MNNKIYIHIIEFILIIGAKNRCIEVIVLVENVFINVGELVIWKSLILFKTRQIPKQETTAIPQSSIHFHHLIITRSERTMYFGELETTYVEIIRVVARSSKQTSYICAQDL